ncbi:unnamed protein product [Nesidiocoris tenuis]|uniref:Uncharacterized protein n=1 Tax=Nesidiocoris tenuis TaxID=355587 RepID=A0A6H5HTU1_9HEMI|nr:unnamed protein product [Nesidiocoris tenuis]
MTGSSVKLPVSLMYIHNKKPTPSYTYYEDRIKVNMKSGNQESSRGTLKEIDAASADKCHPRCCSYQKYQISRCAWLVSAPGADPVQLLTLPYPTTPLRPKGIE